MATADVDVEALAKTWAVRPLRAELAPTAAALADRLEAAYLDDPMGSPLDLQAFYLPNVRTFAAAGAIYDDEALERALTHRDALDPGTPGERVYRVCDTATPETDGRAATVIIAGLASRADAWERQAAQTAAALDIATGHGCHASVLAAAFVHAVRWWHRLADDRPIRPDVPGTPLPPTPIFLLGRDPRIVAVQLLRMAAMPAVAPLVAKLPLTAAGMQEATRTPGGLAAFNVRVRAFNDRRLAAWQATLDRLRAAEGIGPAPAGGELSAVRSLWASLGGASPADTPDQPGGALPAPEVLAAVFRQTGMTPDDLGQATPETFMRWASAAADAAEVASEHREQVKAMLAWVHRGGGTADADTTFGCGSPAEEVSASARARRRPRMDDAEAVRVAGELAAMKRRDPNLTQRAAADTLGVAAGTLSRWITTHGPISTAWHGGDSTPDAHARRARDLD